MDNFSNLMMIGECLLDNKRTNLFKEAIKSVVKPGDTVLDGGTGSGILAILAAEAGAKKVYAIEIDPEIAKIAERNIKHNNLDNIIEVIIADLKNVSIPKVDVLIMEMMDTGLIAEQQVPAINNLVGSGVIGNSTNIIPSICETYIEFVKYDFTFHGLEMPFIIQARNFSATKRILDTYSDLILLNKIYLNRINDLAVTFQGKFTARMDGEVNSIVLKSKINLTDEIATWGTTDMNMPISIPIPTKHVSKGSNMNFKISYTLAHGFDSIDFNWL